ncbi:HIT family protein [Methanoregula sp.]|uniref:HIT family protein n=1 Tax=Methanoregula sp. TaxID=2052170 RepID=UPI003C72FE1B
MIEENFTPAGYNIGFNVGTAAGQTVMHCHCHVIPRYAGDVGDPRGGVGGLCRGGGGIEEGDIWAGRSVFFFLRNFHGT